MNFIFEKTCLTFKNNNNNNRKVALQIYRWSYISFRFLDVFGQTIKSLVLLFPLKVKVTDVERRWPGAVKYYIPSPAPYAWMF